MSEAEVKRAAEEAENERPSLNWQSSWNVAVSALVVLLSLAGIGVSGYLTYAYWFEESVACAGLSSCSAVAESAYSHMGPIPIAFFGVLGYVALLAVAAFWLRVGDRWGDWPLLAIWGMALGGVAYSAYLTYLEIFVIEAACIWCVSSAVIMVGILLVSTAGILTIGGQEEEE
jgi:uncharacterized membrane protein